MKLKVNFLYITIAVLAVGLISTDVFGQGPIRRAFQRMAQRNQASQQAFVYETQPQVVTFGQAICTGENCVQQPATPQDAGYQKVSFTPEPTDSFNADIPVTVLESKQRFRRSLLRAAAEARKQGKITARESIRIRVASFSPAFLQHAEDLAVIQMAFSGENDSDIPRDAEGRIQRQSINWEGLTQFLQALLPLILAIIEALGA
jgi:hypothetical protein